VPAIDRARVAAALPRYALGEQLGSGSFGLVLAGRHLDLERAVAVKVLPINDPADGPALGATFRAEARMLSRLDHPHIVRIYEYIGQDDHCLLIMELLGGGTLAQHRLPPAAACAVGLAVADALSHAHAQGVLHRDIKPDNILFTVAGQPKLTDFGIGRVFEDASGSTSHLAGTPRYMAPEQITGRHLGPAVDQYALGVVLYELLAGRPPFSPGLPVPDLLRHHLEEPPPSLAGTPAPVADVVLRALAKAPGDRFANAEAFGRALADAAATAYGPDWLALTGLVVRLHEGTDGHRARRQPDSGGHVFTPATARLETPPASLTPPQVPDAATDRSVPTTDLARLDGRREAATGPHRTPETGATTGTATTGPGGTRQDSLPQDVHPFAGTGFGAGLTGRRRFRGRRGVVMIAASVVAVVVAVTAVVLVTADGGRHPDPAAAGRTATASQPQADGEAGEVALPEQFSGWAAGADGVLYFSDQASNRILRRDRQGKITIIAGTGVKASTGDGGPASAAALNSPTGLAIDATGNLYFQDGDTHIRRIDPHGQITTVAGGGDPSTGTEPTGPVDARSASLKYLADDIALDRTTGDLYFADTARVYRLDAAGIVTPIAHLGERQTPAAGTTDPDAALPQLAIGALDGLVAYDGRVYLADDTTNEVMVLDRGGRPRVFAGTGAKGFSGDGGPATNARFDLSSLVVYENSALAVDGDGDLYIADNGNWRVRRVDARTGTVTSYAGKGYGGDYAQGKPAADQPLYGVERVAIADDGTLYLETGPDILKVDTAGDLWVVQTF
jgi:hypothetical protein